MTRVPMESGIARRLCPNKLRDTRLINVDLPTNNAGFGRMGPKPREEPVCRLAPALRVDVAFLAAVPIRLLADNEASLLLSRYAGPHRRR
jgi:hypothetical protein